MRTRGLAAIIAAGALALGLTACGSNDKKSSGATTATQTTGVAVSAAVGAAKQVCQAATNSISDASTKAAVLKDCDKIGTGSTSANAQDQVNSALKAAKQACLDNVKKIPIQQAQAPAKAACEKISSP